ncbi:MAG: hypothetical protein IT356_13080 [Gemmatimonadaceae bacterium]|nr:hypothetical protein [Gemmatimonadaceae bacterium]
MSERRARSYLWDVGALSGLAAVGVGLWWIYPPACLIVCGAAVLGFCMMGAKAWAARPGQWQG